MLVDLQGDKKLYLSLTIFDHGMRVNWTENVLRTGVPPTNSLYLYQHAAPMRYYYFWYVLCAVAARMSTLPAGPVFNAGCVWSGFFLAALIGLYLKHFLSVGNRLRRQFLVAIGLLTVTGIGACVNLWRYFYWHLPLPGELEVWNGGQIPSWFNSLLWAPHHVASLSCCMFGLLLAWLSERGESRERAANLVFISLAFASAFGLSIYVTFAFFLVMVIYALGQIVLTRKVGFFRPIAAGGAAAALLLIPYLIELMHNSSSVMGQGGHNSLFAFAVREMIPPDGLLTQSFFQHLASSNPSVARSLANVILLLPGYAGELGFYFVVFLICLVPVFRRGTILSPARRTLVVISVITLVIITFVRSVVIGQNDFGWRGALFLQFAMLLFGSELLASWKLAETKQPSSVNLEGLPGQTPQFVRAIASFLLIFGVMTSVYQALMIRFMIPAHEKRLKVAHDPKADDLAHKTYISAVGYAKLNAVIPLDAVVQYNPWSPDPFWTSMDWRDIGRQSAIVSDKGGCGSEFGGDPSGCATMAAAIDGLYTDTGVAAEKARSTCRQYSIQYLVARIYDPVWDNKKSWVWTLKPVVADDEFRALDCRE
jgi:hypothetical protein